ncbi:MAG: DNA mismatch repair endonuclease MutL [Bacteroides sp.]|nr:DNA mismatch repair endonuclease MutL [Bacteroides sp.]
MSDVIKLLPDSVANQIAAGEVIQRPASVIKELVENAVDAGATDIRIYIKDAGRTMIQVVDNGRGMTETDARMAFERHATSKISSAEDLFKLRTMGFRGEALPSICAIAQVELLTRTADDSIGTKLLINATSVESQEPVMCDVGTNIMVRNIFYNVPARRKFLKSDSVELSNIMREFERLALVNNHVHMLIDTGGRVLDLRAGSFKQRISDIWKNNLNMQLLPVEVDTSLVKIEGFISRPEFARRRNPLQYLIANGRNMRHPYFHKAVINCYESLIASDTQPCYFLKFEVDPNTIDVNIHPTKSEIKFEYEQQIWPILQAAVKASLGQFGAVPSIDFTSDVLPVEPIAEGEQPEPPALDLKANYNPFEEGGEVRTGVGASFENSQPPRPQVNSSWRPTKVSGNWDRLYNDFMAGGGEVEIVEAAKLPELDTAEVPAATCVQFALRYIVTATRNGLLLIDQHRAHVKILYERFLSHAVKGAQVAQGVMFPEVLTLDPEHEAALEEARDALTRLGFVLERDDSDRWKIMTVPGTPGSLRGADVIMALLDDMCDGSLHYGDGSLTPELLMSRIALATARSNAVERGQRLTADEMEHIVGELFSLPEPARGPDGKAVYVSLDETQIERYL